MRPAGWQLSCPPAFAFGTPSSRVAMHHTERDPSPKSSDSRATHLDEQQVRARLDGAGRELRAHAVRAAEVVVLGERGRLERAGRLVHAQPPKHLPRTPKPRAAVASRAPRRAGAPRCDRERARERAKERARVGDDRESDKVREREREQERAREAKTDQERRRERRERERTSPTVRRRAARSRDEERSPTARAAAAAGASLFVAAAAAAPPPPVCRRTVSKFESHAEKSTFMSGSLTWKLQKCSGESRPNTDDAPPPPPPRESASTCVSNA